jgi:hypothetical protein
MRDVIVRVAPSDRSFGQSLAEALTRDGHEVELTDAVTPAKSPPKAEIVVWSGGDASPPQGFLEAARAAFDRDALIAVRLADAVPAPFSSGSAEDLRGFTGALDHPGFRAVSKAASRLTLREGPPAKARKTRPLLAGALILAISILIAIILHNTQPLSF